MSATEKFARLDGASDTARTTAETGSVDHGRRGLLKIAALAGGGMMLEGWLPAALATPPSVRPAANAEGTPLGYFVNIHPDNTVEFILTRHEMGQGVGTALAMIVAEELGADWNLMRISVPSTSNPRYELNGTGGSTTLRDAFLPLRRGSALARQALVAAAARRWNIAGELCTTVDSHVLGPAGRKLAFGALANEAAMLGVVPENPAAFRAVTPAPALRPIDQPRLLGKPKKNVFADAIVRGKQAYGIDAVLPGMLYASVERAPQLRGSVKRVDASAALKVPGVKKVVQFDGYLDPMRGVAAPASFSSGKAGVAVLADSTWAALQGRRALVVEWHAPEGTAHDLASWQSTVNGLLDGELKTVEERGSAPQGRDSEFHVAEYLYPFQAHACMEPMNCLAHHRGQGAEVWVSTQGATPFRSRIASQFQLAPADVVVHAQFSGGAFGRRFYSDPAIEALQISQAAGHLPVKVIWTREDDLRHDHYHPWYQGRFRALLNADGSLASFEHSEARAYWGDPANEGQWFCYDSPHMRYAFANAQSASPVQGGAWRSVVANNWAFGQECFIDELAHKAGKDPLAWRRAALASGKDTPGKRYTVSNSRTRGVLEALAEKAGWASPPVAVAGSRTGRGMALFPYLHGDSYGAMAIDVAVDARNQLTVTRVVAVVDCGQVINPDGARQQVEGGIIWGLSAALHGGIRIVDGAVVNANFHDTPVLRHSETPQRIEVHFVEVPGKAPTGLGEIAPPLVAPALCNAIFAATGKRIRQLPISLA